MPVISADERCVACGPGCLLQMSRLQRPKRQRWRELRERRLSSCTGAGGARELKRAGPFLAPDPSQIRHARQRVAHLCSHVGIGWILWAGRVELESSISCVECPRRPSLNVCSSGGRVKQLRAPLPQCSAGGANRILFRCENKSTYKISMPPVYFARSSVLYAQATEMQRPDGACITKG